jgi:hypothetical protein
LLPEKSAVVEHSIEAEHGIDYKSIFILGNVIEYINCTVKEAREIQLHSNNFSINGGFTLSQA